MKQLHADGLFESLDYESLDACEPCLMGKMTKTSFYRTMEGATDLLEIIHTDVCGPMSVEARGGCRYFLTFISAQIICEGRKIMIPATSLNIHRTTYICMYDFQEICCSLHSSGERRFSHACPWGTVRKYQVIHNQVVSKVHQYGVSSCALHQYDLNGSATNKLHYHY